MTGWRTALRVARREARRARGRSALIVAMIALPVAALAFGAVSQDTFTLTPGERANRLMGTSQAAMIWEHGGPVYQEPAKLLFMPVGAAPSDPPKPTVERLLAFLPPGSRAISDQTGRVSVRTADGVGTVNARMLDYADPLARGILRPLSGRAPASPGEVALTPAAARRLDTGLGGTVRLADRSRTFRVVGTVEDPTDLAATTLVLPAGTVAPQRVTWLVATPDPLTWAQVKQLNTHGVVAVSRYVLAHPPSEDERYPNFAIGEGPPLAVFVLVGGLAMLEIVLLAGSAFAVGARRRRHDLALVAAAGGTPAHVRRIVLADGVVLGVAAAAVGVALGVATAAAGRPLIEYLAHVRSGGFRVFPVALAVLAGLAVAAGALAALVPAWIASRQDVVTALAGRRGIIRSRRRWMVLGVGLAAAGAVTAAVGAWRTQEALILAGLVAVELGLVLCTPAIVGLVTRLGRFLPLAPRIALRDTSRNRTAAAPAIAAVMAAVIGSLAVAVVLTATDTRARENYRPLGRQGTVYVYAPQPRNGPSGGTPTPDVVAALRSTMPVEEIHQISGTSCGGAPCLLIQQAPTGRACLYARSTLRREPTGAEQHAARRDARCDGVNSDYRYFGGAFGSDVGMSLIIDPAAVGALIDMTPEDADQAATALRAGAVVIDNPRYLDNGQVTLAIEMIGQRRQTRTISVPGFAPAHRPRAPITLLTSQTARTLGLSPSALVTLATTSRMPTTAEQDRLQAAVGNGYEVKVERSPEPNNAALLVLAIVAAVIALGAAAVATGLAAADGRADLATLAAVGAAPRVRRALSLSQAGVIAGLGSLLGTVAGLGAATAVLAALNRGYADVWPAPTAYPITVPWLNVGLALLAVPVVAMLGAGLLTRSRLPIERRL